VETPANNPKRKNIGKDEVELTLIKLVKPLFLIKKKPMMINKAAPTMKKKPFPCFCSAVFMGWSEKE